MSYREIVKRLCGAFPNPVIDRPQDAYLITTFMRALDQVTNLKDQTPILKKREDLDYRKARSRKIAHEPSYNLENLTSELVDYLEGMTIWGHPHTQENVIPPPSIPSLVGLMLAGLYNPILAWDAYSHKVALAEVELVAMMSDLIGYDPNVASGLFTFGGTGTVLYGMKVAIEKALPGAMKNGVGEGAVILVSDCGHYCAHTVASWLGLGTDSLVEISTDANHEMNIEVLKKKAHDALDNGRKIAGIICTMGTTDHFGIDNLEGVVRVRDELVKEFRLQYQPHIHADAVIGWVWSVFKDYFGPTDDADPLNFKSSGTYHSLALATMKINQLNLADSLGVDFHKTGFTPCVSSLVLFKNRRNEDGKIEDDLHLLRRDQKKMPYLYQFGDYHPGEYTLETTRSGVGVLAALANLKLFGKQGLQAMIGYLVEMRLRLCSTLSNDAHITILNQDNHGTVTLFRVYPDGVKTPIKIKELTQSKFRDSLLYYNAYNICIERYLHNEAMNGKGVVISKTDKYRTTDYQDKTFNQPLPVVALKSFILSPFFNEYSVDLVIRNILQARKQVNEQQVMSALKKHIQKTFRDKDVARDEDKLEAEVKRIVEAVTR